MINYLVSQSQSSKVELIQAGSLEGGLYQGKNIRRLIGSVIFKQDGKMLYCDSAYQYEKSNDFECFGNVRIVQNDKQNISSKHLFYNGITKIAQLRGDVVMVKDKTILYTQNLDYDMPKDEAFYFGGGRIIDKDNILTSEKGNYFKSTDVFSFKKNVVLTNAQYTIETDTMQYHATTKIVYFKGPTKLKGKEGDIFADAGEYNTITQTSDFKGRAKVIYTDYILNADKIVYDELLKAGKANGNVEMISRKDSMVVYGDHALYWGKTGKTKVFGHAYLKSKAENDTLFLAADTLISINDSVKKDKKILAYHHVKIFKTDFQGICDSLSYNLQDSIMQFYKDPVLWAAKNQMNGDSIKMMFKHKKLDKIYFRNKSFVISVDTMKNYNQVKGKHMIVHMKDNKINRIEVFQQSESIYYALEGDTVVSGVNRVTSENMRIKFLNNKVKTITFLKKPNALYIPPHELKDEQTRIKGFRWREAEKPTKKMVKYKL